MSFVLDHSSPARMFTLASLRSENGGAPAAYRIERDLLDERVIRLLEQPEGTSEATIVWQGRCETEADAEAVAAGWGDMRSEGALRIGRTITSLGSQCGDAIFAGLIEHARTAAQEKRRKQEEYARKRLIVRLWARDDRAGFYLELRRDSESSADWKIAFRGRAERERMRDYLRWQEPRFLEYLDYADRQGWEALSQLVIDEMFETERWVKAQGLSAGGGRPLRFWRGQ